MHTPVQRRPRLRSALAAGGLALGLTLLSAGSASAAPVVENVTLAATPAVEIGETVDVSTVLVATTDVYSYSVTFAFDPALLAYEAGSATTGPAGGFDTVTLGAGTVTVLHSRLGTSPALAGDLPVALAFDTIGSGDATITESVTLVDTVGGTTVVDDAATAEVAIAALPVVVPPVTPPVVTAPAPAAIVPSNAPRNADGSLALTGFDGGALIAFAAVGLAAIGAGAVVVRRKTAGTR
jgi:hypothetical protein